MVLQVFIFVVFLLFCEKISCVVIGEKECSKFDYEYRVLERIIFLENKNAELQEKQMILEKKNEHLVEIVKEQRLEMERKDKQLENANTEMMLELKTELKIQNASMTRLETKLNNFDKDQTAERESLRNVMEMKNKEQDDAREKIKLQFEQKIGSHDQDTLRLETMLAEVANQTTNGGAQSLLTLAKIPRQYLRPGAVIKFSTIVYNVGNAYSANTGIFTAPAEGTYLFSVKICMDNDDWASVSILRGDTLLSKFGVGDVPRSVCVSDIVVVKLISGESISVKTTAVNGGYLSNPGYSISAFTAALL